jgi:hypothetical protein
VGVLFYLRSDEQYILVGDAIMAVFCHQLKYIVHLTLGRKERPLSIRTSLSIIINKNTAMIVSLTKIYCPSDLKYKRTPTVYQNVTQYNNTKNTAMIVSPSNIYCPSDLRRKERPLSIRTTHRIIVNKTTPFYLRSDAQYALISDTIIAVFLFMFIL